MSFITLMASTLLAASMVVSPNPTTEPTQPPVTDTPTITPTDPATKPPTKPPVKNPETKRLYLKGDVWVDDNFNGKKDSKEKETPEVNIFLSYTDGTREIIYTHNGKIPKTDIVMKELSTIEFRATKEYTVGLKRTITNPEAHLSGNTYSFNVQLLPKLDANVSEEHTADGTDYTITYTIENSGYKTLSISDSLDACNNVSTVAAHSTVQCERKSSYYVKDKNLQVPNTITLKYAGRTVEEQKFNTTITDKSPEESKTVEPTSKPSTTPSPKKTASPEKTEAPTQAPVETVEKTPKGFVITALIVFIACISGIIAIVIRNKKEAKKHAEKAKNKGMSVPSDEKPKPPEDKKPGKE